MDSYLPHVGYVQFPRRPEDLTGAVCPACFAARSGARCPNCGLDLTHPALTELDAANRDATAALDRRLEVIGRIRFDSAAAAATPAPVATAPAGPGPTVVAPPAPPAEPRRHLGVQVILLIVGVSLLAVGAIFFLVYAFITFGLVWRSVIIGAVTVASFVGASLLQRRRLRATAEAFAALAVVFVYLDAFAVRANDLFGLAAADGLVYWGTALLASSVGFAVWHRLSGLRLPSVVAFASFGPAVALLVGGLTVGLDDGVRVLAALLALGAATLVHPLARGRAVERALALILASVSLLGAAGSALLILPSDDWAPLPALALVAAVATAHAVVLQRLRVSRGFSLVLACFAGAVAAAAFVPVALRLADNTVVITLPVLTATAIALALEFGARRMPSPTLRGAAWSAGVVAGITLLIVVSVVLVRAVTIASSGVERWSIRGGTVLGSRPEYAPATIALAVVVVLAAGAWALGGVLKARRVPLLAGALGVLVLAVPLTGLLWTTVLGWLLIGVAAVVLLIVGRRLGWRTGIRIALMAAGLVSLALSYATSWASIDTWWFGSVGAVAALVAARSATGLVPVRAALIAGATVLAFVAIGSEAWHTNERFQGGRDAGVDALHAVLLLSILLVALSAFVSSRLSRPETRVLFWLPFATALVATALSAGVSAVGGTPALVLPEWWTSLTLGVFLTAALCAWMPRTGWPAEQFASSLALAPVAAWLGDSLRRLLALPEFAMWTVPLLVVVIVAAVSLALSSRGSRAARDLGVAAATAPLLIAAVVSGAGTAWLSLLLAGGIALLLAVSRDGLFGSRSPRKHLGWIALALAFGGLASSLAERGVTNLEPYVLPLGGALLLIALLAWRVERAHPAPAIIALGGLLVCLVPLGVVSGSGAPARGIVVAGVSALLLLAGSLLRGSRYLDVAAAAGAAGLIVAGASRPVALAIAGQTGDPALDVWLAATLAVLLVAAVGHARATAGMRGTIAQIAVTATLALVVIIEVSVLREDALGAARALVLTGVLAALSVAGMLLERPPFTRTVAWIVLALAAITSIVGAAVGAVDPFEWATGILALALLVPGAVLLRRYPGASSWQWLAPGLLVLLLPSLVATFVDQPLWRLVGLGVVCVAAILGGALLKLQAPLLIGTAVVLIHAVHTFAPQLVAVYQLTEWWVWAVVGGAIIIFVAVTFERRIRDLRSVGTRIAALR